MWLLDLIPFKSCAALGQRRVCITFRGAGTLLGLLLESVFSSMAEYCHYFILQHNNFLFYVKKMSMDKGWVEQ